MTNFQCIFIVTALLLNAKVSPRTVGVYITAAALLLWAERILIRNGLM